MPKKSSDTAQSDSASGPSSTMTISMTNEQLLMLIEEICDYAQLSNAELLKCVCGPIHSTVNVTQTCNKYFTKCIARFHGSDTSDVDAFIDNIETFKECSNVSDANALKGFSMILDGIAATWWYENG